MDAEMGQSMRALKNAIGFDDASLELRRYHSKIKHSSHTHCESQEKSCILWALKKNIRRKTPYVITHELRNQGNLKKTVKNATHK